MSSIQAILDEMVDDFVDKISETFSHRKYYTSISEPRVRNIHFTIKKKKRLFWLKGREIPILCGKRKYRFYLWVLW